MRNGITNFEIIEFIDKKSQVSALYAKFQKVGMCHQRCE